MAKSKKEINKAITSVASMNKAIKSICNILRRDKAKGARLYVPELTWLFFLLYLDIKEQLAEKKATALNLEYSLVLPSPYKWCDWAAPYSKSKSKDDIIANKEQGWKRCELDNSSTGAYLKFVNDELFPYLKSLREDNNATHLQRIVAEIFINKEKTIVASVTNLQDVIDKVHELSDANISDQHMFPISQAFEGLLPSLGEKKNDGGQFFTPREVIRLIVEVVNPQLEKSVYDPCCGTGGFLIEAYKHMLKQNPTPTQIEALKSEAFFGREDADEAIPILLANMALHDIDLPRIWHGNTLTSAVTYGDLFKGAPNQFDFILTNPPFGSKEGKAAQAQFAYKCGKAQILFLQHIIDSLADGGVCGMVIDEGVLFHTKTAAYKQTKRKLLNDCDLFCIISLPGGVFVNAGAGVKTDLFFFRKGLPTEKIWYYDMTLGDDFKPRKVNKGNPLEYKHFEDFLYRLRLPDDSPEKISERSWWSTREEVEGKQYDLKAVNNNAPDFSDKRTPDQLYKIISDAQGEINKGLKALTGGKVIYPENDAIITAGEG
ncbi:MAG: N-6 DNA methylase [Chitinophagaceae bacterium]|nr:N-6 DNA methylase [Chitinophagaceae bacterium]